MKDQALKQSLLEKSEVLEETRKDLGRQQERIQVSYRRQHRSSIDADAGQTSTLLRCLMIVFQFMVLLWLVMVVRSTSKTKFISASFSLLLGKK